MINYPNAQRLQTLKIENCQMKIEANGVSV